MSKIQAILFLLLTFTSLLVAQVDDNLPDKEAVIDTSADKEIIPDYLNEYDQAYYKIDYINRGLGDVPVPMNRFTPQAAMETFFVSCRSGEFDRAAHVLNLNLLPEVAQINEAEILAEKLYYIINRRLQISWNDIPDRPDGQIDIAGAGQDNIAGKPRRNVNIGTLKSEERDVKIGLQRVKVKDTAPYWVISAQTVEHIEELYKEFGPSPLSQEMPDWSKVVVMGIQLWRILGLIILIILCVVTFLLIRGFLKYAGKKFDHFWISNISKKIATPIAFLTSFILFSFVFENVISLSGSWSPIIYSLMTVLIIATLIWTIITTVDYVFNLISEYRIDDISDEENQSSRELLTYISVGRKVLTFVLIIVGMGMVLTQFDALQTIGFSMLASAGAATIILGIAAQGTLGNLFAGLQIAFSNPINIGDTIEFEDHFGVIENIRFTYVVIKTWDDKRVIVPLQYFISQPFENWSKGSAHTVKTITVYADPRTDVGKVREKVIEIMKEKGDYEMEHEPKIEVTSVDPRSVEIRILIHGKDPGTAWDHEVALREEIINFVANYNDGQMLVKERQIEISEGN
ncbi:mechanosensitive ion channel family protein [Portibacter marinus]|uniref:mechanosensitive ion channel family protein n=1 Tax=Portibacter marinus TaxID=2898660 RepID=UPI001F2AFE84|nr:mechanosensitive ion channel family protein [Portibacter marinus]